MRVAALAFGVLAGLVASFILALGGLDVTADLGAAADRQSQAIRFGLFVIGNLGIFGAALALAAPLAGAVFLLLGAVAWVGAALLMHHSTDLVLVTPPALLLIAAVLAIVAHFRRPRPEPADDADMEIMAPRRTGRDPPPDDATDTEEDVGIPAFAAEARPDSALKGAFDFDREQPQGKDWNPRRRQPPPPRTKPAFLPVEEEYDDDDEPSGFSRFAQNVSGVLSFGLYAALAGATVLIFWTARNETDRPTATVAEAPSLSSSVEAPPASSEQPRLPSQEQTLQPILTGEPIRDVDATPTTAPSTTPTELVAETAPTQEPGTFGAVTLPDGPVMIPTLSDDFSSDDEATPLPPVSAAPPALPEEPLAEPQPLDLESPPPEPSVPAEGQPFPRAISTQMAALRTAPATGPTVVSTPLSNATNTGL